MKAKRSTGFIAGAAIGGGLIYLFDKSNGAQRRARLGEQLAGARQSLGSLAGGNDEPGGSTSSLPILSETLSPPTRIATVAGGCGLAVAGVRHGGLLGWGLAASGALLAASGLQADVADATSSGSWIDETGAGAMNRKSGTSFDTGKPAIDAKAGGGTSTPVTGTPGATTGATPGATPAGTRKESSSRPTGSTGGAKDSTPSIDDDGIGAGSNGGGRKAEHGAR